MECDIDLVVPMVFPGDPEWQAEHARYHGGNAARHVRFRSWGTEELLIKCCMKYMPWLRCIHILLAGESQVQSWMVGNPRLHIVFHRNFIPAAHLPCFSSPCIEMFLHRIPSLSEYFIYANDDMFPLSPLGESDFFQCVGGSFLPCQEVGESPYPAQPNLWHKACMGGLNMIAAPFGKHYTKTFMRNGHSFAAYLKSACEEVWRRHGEEILAHLCPLSRKADSYSQYIYGYYQQLAGLHVHHAPRHQYVGPNSSLDRITGIIRDPAAGIVCLNDNECIKDWERRAAVVRREITSKIKK